MAVYSNTISDTDASVAVGSPTLAIADVVNLVEGTTGYTTNLSGLGTTQFDTLLMGPGFSGVVGDYPAGLLVVAKKIYCESRSPLVSIKGDNLGGTTTDLIVWKNLVGAKGKISEYGDLTRLDVLAGGTLRVDETTNVDNVYVKSGGISLNLEEGGDAITLLECAVPANKNGGCRVDVGRDVATIDIGSRVEVVSHSSCSPTTVRNSGGTLRHSGAAITTVEAKAGVFDFSQAVADVVITTWTITGDITIIRPPTGISVTMPTTLQEGAYRIDYRDAA